MVRNALLQSPILCPSYCFSIVGITIYVNWYRGSLVFPAAFVNGNNRDKQTLAKMGSIGSCVCGDIKRVQIFWTKYVGTLADDIMVGLDQPFYSECMFPGLVNGHFALSERRVPTTIS
ncbi:hypothetical protein L6452_13077 [Arctium lappa]|uniref:Uncharacterized protein n=1 Tax=Arctium lappa TaxID=4217 RepID=A0ACB9CH71_ARCLA|nr:hypothetical protein L6452_13077 [Arctium lappa]